MESVQALALRLEEWQNYEHINIGIFGLIFRFYFLKDLFVCERASTRISRGSITQRETGSLPSKEPDVGLDSPGPWDHELRADP